MNNYDRILKMELAINHLNGKIYACEKNLKEYRGLIKKCKFNPKLSHVDINIYLSIIRKIEKELEMLRKIRKNLVKAIINHIKEQAEEYGELHIPEIRSLFNAIDNLK